MEAAATNTLDTIKRSIRLRRPTMSVVRNVMISCSSCSLIGSNRCSIQPSRQGLGDHCENYRENEERPRRASGYAFVLRDLKSITQYARRETQYETYKTEPGKNHRCPFPPTEARCFESVKDCHAQNGHREDG